MCGAPRCLLIGGVLVMVMAAPLSASGQGAPGSSAPVTSKLFVGGSFGLSIGDVDYIEIAPLVGAWLSPQVSVGGSLIFRYRNDAIVRMSGGDIDSVSTTDYGGSVFGRYFLWEPLYVHAEIEYLSYEYADFDFTTERDDFTSVFVGGGAATGIGGRSSVYVQMLYNLSYSDDELSPYGSPWVVRIGIGVGF
jgi:hypothetical protein